MEEIITIDPEFRDFLPALPEDKRQQLEQNILANGCRDPLVLWEGILIDGHNRKAICDAHGVEYQTVSYQFDSRDDVKLWIADNQFGRRDLSTYERCELAFKCEPAIRKRAEANRETVGKQTGRGNKKVLQDSAEPFSPVDTREELAKIARTSHDTVAKAKKIHEHADEDTKAKLRAGEISVNKAYGDVVREEKRATTIETLRAVESVSPEAFSGKYDVVVLDPPWDMQKIERDVTPNQVAFEYPTMTEDQLANLVLPMSDSCHVWCWTTNKFLPMAMRLLTAWKLKYVCEFVWDKGGGFQPFGMPQYRHEQVLYARKGTPIFTTTKDFGTVIRAPRGEHSEKPEAFYDMVRRVTAGKRLDMFNRRAIEGFDGWGKESPSDVDATTKVAV